jgi:hypothetical protein
MHSPADLYADARSWLAVLRRNGAICMPTFT